MRLKIGCRMLLLVAVFPFAALAQQEPREPQAIVMPAHERTIRCIAFAPDSKTLWTAGEDGTVKQWSVADRSFIRQLGERGRLFGALAVSRDGKTVVAAGSGSGIQFWDAPSGRQRASVAPERSVVGLDLSPDGRRLAAAFLLADHAAVFDAATGEPIATLTEPAYQDQAAQPSNDRAMGTVAYSPDGKYLAVCNAPPNYMSVVSLYDAQTHTLRSRFVAHALNRAYCLAFSPDGKLVACGTQDGHVKVFEVAAAVRAWQERNESTALEVRSAAAAVARLAPALAADDFNGREAATRQIEALGQAAREPLTKLAAETSDAEVRHRAQQIAQRLKEAADGPLRSVVPLHMLYVRRTGSVRSLAFSPDGRLLAVGSMRLGTPNGQLELWELDRPDKPSRIVPAQPVNWLSISPDGEWVACGLTGGSILLTKAR